MGSGKLLKKAIQKYGIESFTKEILFIFDNEDDMNRMEKELVILDEQSYNLCPGGQGGFGYINANELYNKEARIQASKEALWKKYGVNSTAKIDFVKDKISKKIRKKISEGWKPNPPSFKGQRHSEDTKKEIGANSSRHQKGKGNSQFGTCWITNGVINKKIKKDSVMPEGYHRGRV